MYQSGRYSFGGLLTRATRFLLIATGIIFLVQLILAPLTGGRFIMIFGLSWAGISQLHLWQLVTYIFLHGNLLHIFLNMLGLFFFGPETERALGTRRFLVLYLACGILGGLGWLLLTPYQAPAFCIGASGAVYGILGAFAALFPRRPITLLVFFVIPVTMQARTMAIALAIISLLATVGQPGQIAHAAHLAGGIAGYLYILLFNPHGSYAVRPTVRQLLNDLVWRWHRRKFKVIQEGNGDDDASEEPPTQAEVNAVLDQISKFGIKSLTQREHDILTRASRATGRNWRNK